MLDTSKDRSTAAPLADEIEALHQHCGVYTNLKVVRRILDMIGWRSTSKLGEACLLEPSAGDGAFVIEAGRRLVGALQRQSRALSPDNLVDRIRAFEIHPREARRARSRVREMLQELGINHLTAKACADAWIIKGDFLLARLPPKLFTHVAGNPPYVRWSKIPKSLRTAYELALPPEVTKGDLFLPFIARAVDLLVPGGKMGVICSNRWRYMAFAEGFRRQWLSQLNVLSDRRISAADAFIDTVDSYPSVLIASRRAKRSTVKSSRRKRGQTLLDLGCTVKVGPALGHNAAFVLQPHENDVETELLSPWIHASEVSEGEIRWGGRRVIVPYDQQEGLLDLGKYPLAGARLERFRRDLSRRSIVRDGAVWYRTIDRIKLQDWHRPKLLIPELARIPRLSIDYSGSVPSHGVYAIFAPRDEVEDVYARLSDGKFASAISGIAPRVKGGYVRCYKRFLLMMRF